MVKIKSGREIELMKAGGMVAAEILSETVSRAKPGVSTFELDQFAASLMKKRGVTSPCLGYRLRSGNPYPAHICVSVNEEVVHGIPSAKKIIKDGDCVSIDIAIEYKGYVLDNAKTIIVGENRSSRLEELIEVSEAALKKGIAKAIEGNRVGDISNAIEQTIRGAGLGIVREFVGHGIGRDMHEDPEIPNYGQPATGELLKAGMVLAIEPMVTLGLPQIQVLKDGWTVVTKDKSSSAHVELTVLVEKDQSKVLTIV